ncbi:RNA-guided endonuclease InsQ/TnpB family protein [Helicobacter pylori]|uniref:RNA-guided endonuclease InsQ/TnpB family protein n=1 Tax=Helicobacter pylori TaxID=210 RepID=UPI000993AEDA|nr:RNA-guided endonuclease TnpB family protein [Helicobacter pylori]MUU89263.1 transposase [Helicobacter pylori]OOQ36828.1 transposase [Helicobacter pylori]PDW96205.1 transposase [Helicobacter pylori]PDX14449.1 transposase [Helicobacter pylori]WRC62778.1 transposase [Helicobacter pylori]
MLITYKQKLYKNDKNRRIDTLLRRYGVFYNHCIALHKRYYRLFKKYLKLNDLQKHTTKLKKTHRYAFLKTLGSQTLQDLTERIDKAFKKFFKKQAKLPRFKKVANYKSFTFKSQVDKKTGLNKGVGFEITNNVVSFNGYSFKFVKTYEFNGKPKTLTIKRDNMGDYFLCLVCELENNPNKQTACDKSVGFDFGLRTFLTGSDNTKIESPLFFSKYLPLIRACNRSLSKKKRGSHNRLKARLRLARLHRKIKNLRTDFFYKLANSLAKQYSHIFIEDLNMKSMQKLWGRKVSDIAFSEFVKILENKTHVVKIDRFYPSSKTCSNCLSVDENFNKDIKKIGKTDKEREYHCKYCGLELDRDLNASINIHRVGASILGVEFVRPT